MFKMFFKSLDDVRNSELLTDEVKTYYESIVNSPKSILTLGYVENEYVKPSPLFKYMIENPFEEDIDEELIIKHGGDRTIFGTCALSVAILLNNMKYVNKLFKLNVFHLDAFYTSNLEIAYISNASKEIINLLEEYEFCDKYDYNNFKEIH